MRAAVLGSPIGHSLSPVLHRAAYEALGLDWSYDAVRVESAGLEAFLDELSTEWAGLSLTMPLKEVVLPLLDEVSDEARLLAAVNTVVLRGGRRLGSNTDAAGLAAALTARGLGAPERVTILGSGATARSALGAVARLGGQAADVAARSPEWVTERLHRLGQSLDLRVRVHEWPPQEPLLAAPLVVSTVPAPAGASLAKAGLPERPVGLGLLFDVLYDPWPTPLAAAWDRAGGAVAGGLEMLVEQAVLQVAAMTGQRPPADVLRTAGEAALAARS